MNSRNSRERFRFKPLIDHKEARRLLDKPGGWFSTRRRLLRVECIYVPIYIFNLFTEDRSGHNVLHEVCVDGVEGQFALIHTANQKKNYEAWNAEINFEIDEQNAAVSARKEFRSHIFRFRPGLSIVRTDLAARAWYPYWMGYFESRKGLYYEVIDACNGKVQGVKMKTLFNKIILMKSKK